MPINKREIKYKHKTACAAAWPLNMKDFRRQTCNVILLLVVSWCRLLVTHRRPANRKQRKKITLDGTSRQLWQIQAFCRTTNFSRASFFLVFFVCSLFSRLSNICACDWLIYERQWKVGCWKFGSTDLKLRRWKTGPRLKSIGCVKEAKA